MRAAVHVAGWTGAAFVLLLALVALEWAPLTAFDRDAVVSVTDVTRRHRGYRDAMGTATYLLNSQLILLYTAVIALGAAAALRFALALWLVVVVGLGSAVGPILKQVVGRERPVLAEPVTEFTGLSFPSGHAGSATLVSAALLLAFWPRLGARGRRVAVVLAVAVPAFSAWTRLSSGGHYPSDLLGGFLLGVAWVAAWQPALPALSRRLA